MARDLPNLKALRVFEAAARHENFSRAAEELNVTQSAVSRQVQLLETELGRPLFERRGPRLLLTGIGREYYGIVQESLALIRRGTARLFRPRPSPFLTLSVLPSYASKWLVPRIASFEARFPGVSLRLVSSYALTDFEIATDIDAAVRYGHGEWPGVSAEVILKDLIFPVCSPAVAARLSKPEDLMREKLLVEDPYWDEWQLWAEAAGLTIDPSRIRRLSDDFNIQLQAAAQGQGVALARRLLVADDLRAGRIVSPFSFWVPASVQYYFVCPPERAAEPALRALKEWMQDTAAQTVHDLRA